MVNFLGCICIVAAGVGSVRAQPDARCKFQTKFWPGTLTNVTIPSGGVDRIMSVYMPRRRSGTVPLPAVIHWHGFNAHYPILEYHINVTKVLHQADESGYVVLLPLGTQRKFPFFDDKYADFIKWDPVKLKDRYGWNSIDGGIQGGNASADGEHPADDGAFAEDIVKYVEEKLCVDKNRIHTAGFSNGAFQAYGVGCTMGSRIAGVASNAGLIKKDFLATCEKGVPVPVQSFHSLADPMVTYNGMHGFLNSLGWASQDEVDAMWRKRNLCSDDAKPQISFQSATTTCKKWMCPGAPVESCAVGSSPDRAPCDKCLPKTGLDHCWIGGGLADPHYPTCDPVPGDIDATAHMFKFWDDNYNAQQASSKTVV